MTSERCHTGKQTLACTAEVRMECDRQLGRLPPCPPLRSLARGNHALSLLLPGLSRVFLGQKSCWLLLTLYGKAYHKGTGGDKGREHVGQERGLRTPHWHSGANPGATTAERQGGDKSDTVWVPTCLRTALEIWISLAHYKHIFK